MLKEKPLNQRMKIPLEGETEARDRAGGRTHSLTAIIILLGAALPWLYFLFLVGDPQNAGVGWWWKSAGQTLAQLRFYAKKV